MGHPTPGRDTMNGFPLLSWRQSIAFLLRGMSALLVVAAPAAVAQPSPSGQAVMAWHVTIAPSWFDPSTAPPQITPFGMLYPIPHALVRPYPRQRMGNSPAEAWRRR